MLPPRSFPAWRALLLLAAAASATAEVDLGSLEVRIRSNRDGSDQPALFSVPPAAKPDRVGMRSPLVVSLHSWSTGYARYDSLASTWEGCQRRGWVFLSPHFRGPNNRPEACGSELAVQDVLDAVAYAQVHARVDPQRIFAVGASHMTLVLAHRAPALWAGISAWLPITDLVTFHRFTQAEGLRFAGMVELCCGGPPGRPDTDAEYERRSSLPFLAAARGVPIDINVGIRDGHGGEPIQINQSLRAFNALARANGVADAALSENVVADMTSSAQIPTGLKSAAVVEPERLYPVLLRRSAGPVRLTVFDGGHVWDQGRAGAAEPALEWMAGLTKKGVR
jgi:hypothetical protein